MRKSINFRFLAGLCLGLLGVQAALAAPLIISEFRVRGPSGANDEFVEIFNNTAAPHTVTSSTGTGYGVAASDGTLRFSIPNGTVIPAHGHYLGTNSVAYSLGGYAAGDTTFTTDIPDNAGIALFTTNVPADFAVGTRMDAVGSTSEANTLYKEGTGYPALTPFSIDYAFYRDQCGKAGVITTMGACPNGSATTDSDDNAADFVFVDTNGTSAGAGQRLGAPGPQNLTGPVNNGGGGVQLLDSCSAQYSPPNAVRDFTSVPANNSTFGTEDFRFTYTNTSGAPLTSLRFRIVDLTTFPAPSGIADLRPITSTALVVAVDGPTCDATTANVNVEGTTLEQPPSQPNGSGFNGSLRVNSVTAGTPLANGASVNLRFLNGIQQTGNYKFGLVPEGLPQAGADSGVIYFECATDGGCVTPNVTSIVRADPDPTAAASVNFTVTFDIAVTGVTTDDFVVTSTGSIAGASVSSVSGSGTTYTVTVNTGTGSGTIRLDLVDNDSIVAGAAPLGGIGAGNGNFNTGEFYTVDRAGPTVTIEQAIGQTDPANTAPVNFTVTFSEAVTNFATGDVTLGGTAGATTATVTGSGTTYNVAVTGMSGTGTVTASIAAGVASDALGNPNAASTSADNTVQFTVAGPAGLVTIPTLSLRGLILLALGLLGMVWMVRRRSTR